MPLYEHFCTNQRCRHSAVRFTLRRSFAKMNAPAKCPECFQKAYRCVVPSSPASFRIGGTK